MLLLNVILEFFSQLVDVNIFSRLISRKVSSLTVLLRGSDNFFCNMNFVCLERSLNNKFGYELVKDGYFKFVVLFLRC